MMAKRGSGPPRRPRNPVAKAVRTPAFKMRVVPDKRWKTRLQEEQPERHGPPEVEKDTELDK